jgi:hypothetical protein
MKLFSPRGCAAATFVTAVLASTAQAVPVSLIGAAADPEQSGVLPIVPAPPQILDAAAVAAISDGNDATGYSFKSSAGEYSSSPLSTVGVSMSFDFDVSQFETIDALDFTWVGHYELSDHFFDEGGSDIWLTAGHGSLIRFFHNSNDLGTDAPRTYSATWDRTPDGTGGTVEALLHDDIARVFVQTGLGFTDDGLDHPVLSYLMLDTREVSLNVSGTLKAVAVPTPGPLPLLATGLGLIALLRRRSVPK